jgi:DNA-binding PadR family transcriptional regulator
MPKADMQQSSCSPLQGVLLAIIDETQQPLHGYKLTTLADRRLGPAWDITRQSVYGALKRLERDGLAESAGGDPPRGRRKRKLYAPTPRTEAARAEWMESPLSRDPARGDLQARLAVSRVDDAPRLLRALDAYERDCFAMIRETSEAEVPMGSWKGLTLNLARKSVDVSLQAELEWIAIAREWIADFLSEIRDDASRA